MKRDMTKGELAVLLTKVFIACILCMGIVVGGVLLVNWLFFT